MKPKLYLSLGVGRQNLRENRCGKVRPNVLPLPRKSSPKHDEPRDKELDHVVEI